MSVLLEFSMFPIDKGESVAKYVSKVIKMIDESEYAYQLTPMGTIIETYSVEEALAVVKNTYKVLEPHSNRVYSSIKMDIRKGHIGRLKSKIASVEELIGEVSK